MLDYSHVFGLCIVFLPQGLYLKAEICRQGRIYLMRRSRLRVVNQSEIKSHISYCVTAKSHIKHMGTHEHHPISSSLTHIPLLS